MKDDRPSVGTPAAIAIWSVAAMTIAGVAVAGDQTFFRVAPAPPARIALVGLIGLLAIGWPIWSSGRLTQAFVAAQGVIVLLIASEGVTESMIAIGVWLVGCSSAFGANALAIRWRCERIVIWGSIVGLTGGAETLLLLRTML